MLIQDIKESRVFEHENVLLILTFLWIIYGFPNMRVNCILVIISGIFLAEYWKWHFLRNLP